MLRYAGASLPTVKHRNNTASGVNRFSCLQATAKVVLLQLNAFICVDSYA